LLGAGGFRGRIQLLPLVARSAYQHATAWGNDMAEALVLRGCRTTGAWLKAAPQRPPAVGVLLTGAVVATASLALELWS